MTFAEELSLLADTIIVMLFFGAFFALCLFTIIEASCDPVTGIRARRKTRKNRKQPEQTNDQKT